MYRTNNWRECLYVNHGYYACCMLPVQVCTSDVYAVVFLSMLFISLYTVFQYYVSFLNFWTVIATVFYRNAYSKFRFHYVVYNSIAHPVSYHRWKGIFYVQCLLIFPLSLSNYRLFVYLCNQFLTTYHLTVADSFFCHSVAVLVSLMLVSLI